MADIFDDLEAGGERIIDGWITSRLAESLYLDCKEKADASKPNLSKEDRRNLARAISAFANSEGGTLVWGVEARTENDIDGVVRKHPIASIEAFKNNVEQAISDLVSPPVIGLIFLIVSSSDKNGSGFLAIKVPASERRPHMSRGNSEQGFFFRNGHQSLPMEVFQVRDQMLRLNKATLEFRWDARVITEQVSPSNKQNGSVPVAIELILENNSPLSARFPYMIVRFDSARYMGMGDAYRDLASAGPSISRVSPMMMRPVVVDHRSASKDYEFSGGSECCIHPGTKLRVASIQLFAPASVMINARSGAGTLTPEYQNLLTIIMDVSYGCQDAASQNTALELTGNNVQAKLFENGLTGPIIL